LREARKFMVMATSSTLSPFAFRLVRSWRSRCDCDHKNAFFGAGAAHPLRQQKPCF
jgi:hypothetical protein